MGLVESCSRVCSKEDEQIKTEPNINYFEDNDQNEENNKENVEQNISNVQITNKNVKEINNEKDKIKLETEIRPIRSVKTDYFLKHTNPFEVYSDICEMDTDLRKVSIIPNLEVFRIMKIIPKNLLRNNFLFYKQLNILKDIDHPNITQLYECYDYEYKIYLISEYFSGDSLFNFLVDHHNSLTEENIKVIMYQLLNAIAYLHRKEIIYDNIILKNIYISKIDTKKRRRNSLPKEPKKNNYEICLICSNYSVNNLLSKPIVGFQEHELNRQIMYSSPEKLEKNITPLIDEWACGVLMFMLICGEAPFRGKVNSEIIANIKSGSYFLRSDVGEYFSSNCIDLLEKLLEVNYVNRINAEDALHHSFFSEFFVKKVDDVDLLKKLLLIKKPFSIFHEYVIAYLCYNFIDKIEENKLLKLFRIIDSDNKNVFSLNDLKDTFIENNVDYTSDELNNIIQILDTDKNDKIQYQEFLRAMCDKKDLFNDDNLKSTFLFIDNDNKGFIDVIDIGKFIFKDDDEKHTKEIEDCIKSFGMKNNDKMNLEQFCNVIKNNKYK